MPQITNTTDVSANEKGTENMQEELLNPNTVDQHEEVDPFDEQPVRRSLPYQDLRTVPLNRLLRKCLNGSASIQENNEASQRIYSIWSDIYADKRFASKKRASMTLYYAGANEIVKARKQDVRVSLMSLLGESRISEFMDHNVGNQEYLARFSALDLANIAVGYRDPEDRYKPWTRGLYALSERFENFGTLFAGPSDFLLSFPNTPEDCYALSGDGAHNLMAQAIPQTIQAAPGTSMCVMPGYQDGVPPWADYTMVIPAGSTFQVYLDTDIQTFQHDIRITMPYEVYKWLMLVGIDIETIEHQNPQTQADMRRRMQLCTDICDKKLEGRLPQNAREIDYAESLFRYMNQKKGEKEAIFADGRRLSGMTIENLRSLDAFVPAWTDLQAARDAQAKIRAENRAREKEAQRQRAIARSNGQTPSTPADEPIFTGGDPLMDPDLLP